MQEGYSGRAVQPGTLRASFLLVVVPNSAMETQGGGSCPSSCGAFFAAMVLALGHLSAASFTFKAQVGNRYAVGPRDEDLRPRGVAARLERAHRNFMETFPVFAAAVLMAEYLGATGALSHWGAAIYRWPHLVPAALRNRRSVAENVQLECGDTRPGARDGAGRGQTCLMRAAGRNVAGTQVREGQIRS